MAAGDVKTEYAASSALTISLINLATSSTFLVGRESTAWDNSTNKYLDLLLSGKITTGTTPTVDKEIRIYAYAEIKDGAYPEDITGTDAAVTIASAAERDAALILVKVIRVTATSDVKYNFGPISIASLFGCEMPRKGGIFITHDTAVNLNGTEANQEISIVPKYATAAQ